MTPSPLSDNPATMSPPLPPPPWPEYLQVFLAALCPPDQRHPLASAPQRQGPDPAQPAASAAGTCSPRARWPRGSLRLMEGALRPAAHRRAAACWPRPATPKPWGTGGARFWSRRLLQRGTHRHQCHQSGGAGGDTALRQRPPASQPEPPPLALLRQPCLRQQWPPGRHSGPDLPGGGGGGGDLALTVSRPRAGQPAADGAPDARVTAPSSERGSPCPAGRHG